MATFTQAECHPRPIQLTGNCGLLSRNVVHHQIQRITDEQDSRDFRSSECDLCPNGVSDGSHHSLDSAVAEGHHTKGEPRFASPGDPKRYGGSVLPNKNQFRRFRHATREISTRVVESQEIRRGMRSYTEITTVIQDGPPSGFGARNPADCSRPRKGVVSSNRHGALTSSKFVTTVVSICTSLISRNMA